MRYKIKIALFCALVTISNQSYSEESSYGLGVGLNDGVKIYFPINIGDLIVEPALATYGSDIEETNSSYNYKTLRIGVGLFKNKETYEDTYMYYGGRLGYIKEENASFHKFTSSTYSSSNNEDGYFIAPTLGIQYFITRSISVGIDAAFMYSKIDFKYVDNSSESNGERASYNTEAEVILRYKF